MLRLKRISDLLKLCADDIEVQSRAAIGSMDDAKVAIIQELRNTAREILTSQEYQNSKIKL
jgi:hypothetical protein